MTMFCKGFSVLLLMFALASPSLGQNKLSQTFTIKQSKESSLVYEPETWQLKPDTAYSIRIINQTNSPLCLSLPRNAPGELYLSPGQSFVWNVSFELMQVYDLSCADQQLLPNLHLFIEW